MCSLPEDAEDLARMATREGKEELHKMREKYTSVLDLIRHYSIEGHWGDVMQVLSRVIARKYTIASSSEVHP